MQGFSFVLLHHMIPYYRMTKSFHSFSSRACRYLESQSALKDKIFEIIENKVKTEQLILYSHEVNGRVNELDTKVETYLPIPSHTPFNVEICFQFSPYKESHYCDLDDLVKAFMDSASMILFSDERWCDGIVAFRHKLDQPKSGNRHEVLVQVKVTWQ